MIYYINTLGELIIFAMVNSLCMCRPIMISMRDILRAMSLLHDLNVKLRTFVCLDSNEISK